MQYYGSPDLTASGGNKDAAFLALRKAQGTFLAKAGKEILRAIVPLAAEVRKKEVKYTLSPQEREALIPRKALEDQIVNLEKNFEMLC